MQQEYLVKKWKKNFEKKHIAWHNFGFLEWWLENTQFRDVELGNNFQAYVKKCVLHWIELLCSYTYMVEWQLLINSSYVQLPVAYHIHVSRDLYYIFSVVAVILTSLWPNPLPPPPFPPHEIKHTAKSKQFLLTGWVINSVWYHIAWS